MAPKTIVLQT